MPMELEARTGQGIRYSIDGESGLKQDKKGRYRLVITERDSSSKMEELTSGMLDRGDTTLYVMVDSIPVCSTQIGQVVTDHKIVFGTPEFAGMDTFTEEAALPLKLIEEVQETYLPVSLTARDCQYNGEAVSEFSKYQIEPVFGYRNKTADTIMQDIEEKYPGMTVFCRTEGYSVDRLGIVMLLNLETNDEMVKTAVARAKEIYGDLDLENSIIDTTRIYFTDRFPGEKNAVFTFRKSNFNKTDLPVLFDAGVGFGEIGGFREEIKEAVNGDEFFYEKRDTVYGTYWPWD